LKGSFIEEGRIHGINLVSDREALGGEVPGAGVGTSYLNAWMRSGSQDPSREYSVRNGGSCVPATVRTSAVLQPVRVLHSCRNGCPLNYINFI
jgi:hypothetical protein